MRPLHEQLTGQEILNYLPVNLFDQNEAEIVLGIFVGFYHVDGEAVFTNRGKDIYAAGLHRWPGFVWVPASLIKGAGVAEPARSGPQAKSLVVPRKEGLPLHLDSDFLCIKPLCLEQDGLFV